MPKPHTGPLFLLLTMAMLFSLDGCMPWEPEPAPKPEPPPLQQKKVAAKRSVEDVIALYGETARSRMAPHFKAAGVAYPPKKLMLLAIKDKARLEVWDDSGQSPIYIRTYAIQALSGHSGPKLREGDRQVPEGLYQIVSLNPNSAYHLSLKLNYPNAFDLKQAKAEGRTQPGSNIFIHGKAVSIGCLAMGDGAIEEIFTLIADVGHAQVAVTIAPKDPRKGRLVNPTKLSWVNGLYRQINDTFGRYKPPAKPGHS